MKKGFAIFLTVVYLVLVTGITLQLHYCGGKLNSVKIAFVDNGHTCSCGSKAMKKGCCKNQLLHIKIQDNQKASANIVVSNSWVKHMDAQLPSIVLNYVSLDYFPSTGNYHSPPPKDSNQLLILNNTFRI